MKNFSKSFSEFLNERMENIETTDNDLDLDLTEATTSWKRMMQGISFSKTGPWSLVAIENRKVVGQKIDIKIKDIIPAHFEAMRKEFPNAEIDIEDGHGMIVWSE